MLASQIDGENVVGGFASADDVVVFYALKFLSIVRREYPFWR